MADANTPLFAVLLAGGVGTRLWPVSRQLFPKQLVRFIHEDSLVQTTIKRILPLVDTENIRVVCGRAHYHEIARHMGHLGIDAAGRILAEPCGRNTAPAILLAVLHILRTVDDAVVCVFPADHVIDDIASFHEKVKTAAALARQGRIVTFGIRPHYPETGYGYIEGGEKLSRGALAIKRFVEKPDLQTAEKYLAAGRFFWNSGMFTFSAAAMRDELRRLQPALFERMAQMTASGSMPPEADYRRLENISIDYAVMEKTAGGAVLPSDFGWSDIGSWKSLYDFAAKDAGENVLIGDVIAQEARRALIMSRNRLVAVNNVRDLVVVETPDAVFVSDLETSRNVKHIVESLKAAGRREYFRHGTLVHAWGSRTLLDQTAAYTAERLEIYPGFATPVAKQAAGAVHLSVAAGSVRLFSAERSESLGAGEFAAVDAKEDTQVENTGAQTAVVIRIAHNRRTAR